MQYTVISAKGRVYQFYLRSVAMLWQQAYGGVLLEPSLIQTTETLV